MMLGDQLHRSNPTVQVPPQWDPLFNLKDPTAGSSAGVHSPFSPSEFSPLLEGFGSLHHFLPSNDSDESFDSPHSSDAFSSDHFRMFEFKVRRCARSHDWTECPFAHPGEKARRRDPRRHHYSATPCVEFRKSGSAAGGCKPGDACDPAPGFCSVPTTPTRRRGLRLRLFFHDCMVDGCDASVLVSSNHVNRRLERDADVNLSLPGDALGTWHGTCPQQAGQSWHLPSVVMAKKKKKKATTVVAAASSSSSSSDRVVFKRSKSCKI